MANLTSQIKQHEQLHLSEIFQCEDEVRIETIIKNQQQSK
jgi:hypothetical protein